MPGAQRVPAEQHAQHTQRAQHPAVHSHPQLQRPAATPRVQGASSLSRQSSTSASDDLRLDQLHIGAAPSAPAHPLVAPLPLQRQHAHAAPAGTTPARAAAVAAAAPGVPGRAGLPRAGAAMMALAKDWKERVGRLEAFADSMLVQAEAGYGAGELAEVEKVLPKLMAACEDGHFKVGVWGGVGDGQSSG